jgi:hypothetical protein
MGEPKGIEPVFLDQVGRHGQPTPFLLRVKGNTQVTIFLSYFESIAVTNVL